MGSEKPMDGYLEFKGEGGERGFLDCALFTCDDHPEYINDSDPDEAIEGYLDRVLSPKDTDVLAVLREHCGETVSVYGYRRQVLDLRAHDILERIIEEIDEEHGDPDEATVYTAGMLKAAEALVDAIKTDYRVWTCDQTHSATVNVEAWVREHRPDWLEPSR